MVPISSSISTSISLFRFPLMVLVVYIHSRSELISTSLYRNVDYPIFDMISYLGSSVLASIAVPIYFLISGYLFYNKKYFKTEDYVRNLRKRVNTLLIPYLLWNFIVELCYLAVQTILPSIQTSSRKSVVEYSLCDWIADFWYGNSGSPICYQFWFLRDLIVCVCLSYAIYYCIRYLKLFYIIALFIAWFSDISINVPGVSLVSLFFFSLGGWCRLRCFNIKEFIYKIQKQNYIISFILLIINIVSLYKNTNVTYFLPFTCLSLTLSAICFVYNTSQNNILKRFNIKFFIDRTFFVYAGHGILLTFIVKLMSKFGGLCTEDGYIIMYLFCPILVICILFGIYRIIPQKLLNILCGGR